MITLKGNAPVTVCVFGLYAVGKSSESPISPWPERLLHKEKAPTPGHSESQTEMQVITSLLGARALATKKKFDRPAIMIVIRVECMGQKLDVIMHVCNF